MASQCGNKLRQKIFNYVKQLFPEVICVLDACQSVGQVEVNVKKINCDVLVGSGRKYLRGPRGTGFIYINDKIRQKINPMILDMRNSEIIGNKIKVKKSNIFENFEFSPSLQVGLSKALERVNEYGICNIEQNIIRKVNISQKLESLIKLHSLKI